MTLRPLGPDDATRLQDFFYSHTGETIQMRYGHAVARMTQERAFDLVNVDQARDLALAVLEGEGSTSCIHAVARYYLDADGRSAEVAFVVRESLRRHGLGTMLMQTLVDIARTRGLAALWGRVRRDNLPMLTLFRRFGGAPVPPAEAGDTDWRLRIPLQALAGAEPARTRARAHKARLREKVARLRRRRKRTA